MDNSLTNSKTLLSTAALNNAPIASSVSAIVNTTPALVNAADPLRSMDTARLVKIVCDDNIREVAGNRVAMLLAGPKGDGLALFVSAFQRSFGYDDVGKFGVRVLCAMPEDEQGLFNFRFGYEEGVLHGFKAGIDDTFATVAWFRDAAFTLIAVAIDDEFTRDLGRMLAADFLNGVNPLDGRTAKFLELHYPVLLPAARTCASFISLETTLQAFLTSTAEKGFLAVLAKSNISIATLLGNSLREFVDKFVGLTKDPKAQGAMIGELYGRIGFEIAFEVATVPVKPASATVRAGKDLELAAKAATGIAEKASEVRGALKGIVAAEQMVQTAKTLEEVVREAYLGVRGVRRSYRDLLKRTKEFNEFYRQLARNSGWLDTGDLLIRLDAHHVLEDRVFNALANKPSFAAAFKKLNWQSALDMPAIALETEFHIRSPDKLRTVFGMTDVNLADVKSFTKQLIDHIGPLDQYATFEELLIRYESFYRREVKIIKSGSEVTIPILWPMVKDTFQDIRLTVGLPPAPP